MKSSRRLELEGHAPKRSRLAGSFAKRAAGRERGSAYRMRTGGLGRQLTHLAAHPKVEAGLYERLENSDRPVMEERRYWRYLPGDPAVLRGAEYDGHPAQVRVRRRGANSPAGRTRWGRAEYPWVFSRAGRREVLSFRLSEPPSLQRLPPSSIPSAGRARRISHRSFHRNDGRAGSFGLRGGRSQGRRGTCGLWRIRLSGGGTARRRRGWPCAAVRTAR